MSVSRTTCSRDCPDTCTIEVHKDERGRAVKLAGAADDPVTQGFLCERTQRFLDRQYSPERLASPLLRRQRGEPLQAVSWEEALDFCARKLLAIRREYGPAGILHYRSGGAMGLLKSLSDLLFQEFGPVTVKHGDICSGAGEAAQEADFGQCESSDLFGLEHSRLIVLWGKNVHTSGPHLLPLLMEARRRGARVVGIDPVRTRQVGICDLFLQPKPGCDGNLALGVASWWFAQGRAEGAEYCDNFEEFRALALSRTPAQWADSAGLREDEVLALAQEFAQARPACIQVGWGLARRRQGALTVRLLDALGAITGNLGVPGGGVSYYYGRRTAFDAGFAPKDPPRTFSEPLLGREILAAGDVRAIWVTAANPLAMLPDSGEVARAFAQTELVVVVDTHPTDTTDVADVVLPTLTMLEDDDVLGAYGNHFLRVSQPALEPWGEARHELWIWQEMARRLGLPDELLAGTPREWKKRLTERLEQAGVSLEKMEQGPVRNPFAAPVLFAERHFPTPSGKVQLVTNGPVPEGTDEDYPLILMAVSTPKAQASQWAVPQPGLPVARVHPSCGLEHGAEVWLESRVGRLRVRLSLDEGIRPELVVMAKGGTNREGQCPNLIIRAQETDLGAGAAFYDEPVRLNPDNLSSKMRRSTGLDR